jgi:hypothetical protein
MVTPNGSTGSSDSNSGLVLNRSIQLNTAIRGGANVPPTVNLQLTPNFLRHEIQLSKGRTNGASPGYIAELNKLTGLIIDATEYCACYTIDENAQKSQTLNGERIFQPHLYLFSILIAFEWQPSARTIQRIQVAAKKASDFLYDVTDGFMAIGQVILGSHKLLDAADIQVMASNRFHPRSWISALHEPHKFHPIRVAVYGVRIRDL